MNKELYAALQNRLMKLSLKERLRLSFKYGVSLKHLDYYAHDQSMHTRKDYIAAGFETGGSPQLPGFAGRNVQFASRGTGAGGGGTRVTRAGSRKVGAGKGAGKGTGKGKSLTQKINAHNNARTAFEAEQNRLYGTMKDYIKDMMKEWDTQNPAPAAKTPATKTPATKTPAPAPATSAETTTSNSKPSGKTKPAGTTTRKPKPESDTPAKLSSDERHTNRINHIQNGGKRRLTQESIARLTPQQRREYNQAVREAAKKEATDARAATKKVATDAAAAKKVTDAKAKDDAQKKDDGLGVNSSKWQVGQKPKTDADFEAKRLFEAKSKDNPYKINPFTGKLTKGAIEQLKKDIEERAKQGTAYNVYRSFQELIPMYKRLPNGDRNPKYEAQVSLLRRELNKLQKEFKDNGDSFAAKSPTTPAGGPSAPAGGPTAPTAPNAPAGKRGIQINPAPVVQGRLKKVLDEITKGSVETKSTWQKVKEFFVDPRGFIDRAKLNLYERGWQSTPQKQQALAQSQYLVNQMTPMQVSAFLIARGAGSRNFENTAANRKKVLDSLGGVRILQNHDNAQKDLAIQILAQERWGDITLRAGNSPLVRLPVPPAPSFGPRDGQGGRGRGGTAPSPPAKPSTRKPPPKPPTLRSPGKPGNATPLPRVGNPSTTSKPLARPGDAPPPGATSKPLARPQDNVQAQPKGIIGIPAGVIERDRQQRILDLVKSGWVGGQRPASVGSLVNLPASSTFQRIQDFIKGKS